MRIFLEITVRVLKVTEIGNVNLVYFDGEAHGDFFNGETEGAGCDVQTKGADGVSLSARYVLRGVDRAGKECRIYIDNEASPNEEYTRPTVYTNSEELKPFEALPLRGRITPINGALKIEIFTD